MLSGLGGPREAEGLVAEPEGGRNCRHGSHHRHCHHHHRKRLKRHQVYGFAVYIGKTFTYLEFGFIPRVLTKF